MNHSDENHDEESFPSSKNPKRNWKMTFLNILPNAGNNKLSIVYL